MNKQSVEFSAERDLSPVELKGLQEVEAANAQMGGFVECEAVPEISTNGHEPFVTKPDSRNGRWAKKFHQYDNSDRTPKKRALLDRKAKHNEDTEVEDVKIDSAEDSLSVDIVWVFDSQRVRKFGAPSSGFTLEDMVRRAMQPELPKFDPENPGAFLAILEQTDPFFEPVVPTLRKEARKAGCTVVYMSNLKI